LKEKVDSRNSLKQGRGIGLGLGILFFLLVLHGVSLWNTPRLAPDGDLPLRNSARLFLHGFFDYHGINGSLDITSAREHFQQAADEGFPEAQVMLARMMIEDQPREMNRIDDFTPPLEYNHTALRWLQKAAAAGNHLAQGFLDDHAKTQAFLAQASRGDSEAMFKLGVFYNQARGLPYSRNYSLYYLAKAAAAGHPRAQVMHEEMDVGRKLQVQRYRNSLEGATRGDGRAMYDLAICLWGGIGTDADLNASNDWMAKAAEGGSPEAQAELGSLYLNGWKGSPPDLVQAMIWWDKAARQGNKRGLNNLGWYMLHLRPHEPALSKPKAVAYLENASAQGFAPAQQALEKYGFIASEEGPRISPDISKLSMAALLEKADHGDNDARNLAATRLLEGTGEKPPNLAQAMQYWKLAAASHSPAACFNLGFSLWKTGYQDEGIRLIERAAQEGCRAANSFMTLH